MYACLRLYCKNLHTYLAPVMRHGKFVAEGQSDRREGAEDTICAVSPHDCLTRKSATPCHTFSLLPVTKLSDISTSFGLPFSALLELERLIEFRLPEVELPCDYCVGLTALSFAPGIVILECLCMADAASQAQARKDKAVHRHRVRIQRVDQSQEKGIELVKCLLTFCWKARI